MYFLILFIPLYMFFLFATCANYIGLYGMRVLALINIWLLPIISALAFYEVIYMDCPTFITLGNWIVLQDMTIKFTFIFDNLTVTLVFLISIVSTVVITYSLSYMSHDPHLIRFIAYLFLFSFFMLLFVTSNNYIQLFFGWEGVTCFLFINKLFFLTHSSK